MAAAVDEQASSKKRRDYPALRQESLCRDYFWKASLSIELPLTAHDPVHPQVSSRRQPLIIRVIMVR